MYDFIFKPFNEMTKDDYKKVGFKSGLEIHQQLLTDKNFTPTRNFFAAVLPENTAKITMQKFSGICARHFPKWEYMMAPL